LNAIITPHEEAQTPADIPEIRPGQSIELLKELHILTRDGKLNQDTRRKLKQVYHLYQFIEPLLKGAETLVDHGAGKSYLGFILYDLYFKERATGEISASKRARNWSKNPANWPPGLAFRACVSSPARSRIR
jgi:hypothetical protein